MTPSQKNTWTIIQWSVQRGRAIGRYVGGSCWVYRDVYYRIDGNQAILVS